MLAVMLGLLAAVAWGAADAIARHTGRLLGACAGLMTMCLAGLCAVSVWRIVTGMGWPDWPSWWSLGSITSATIAMLMLYEALRRGPVSLASPVVSAYPAWMVAIALAMGEVPSLLILLAMLLTMGGVALVAATAAPDPSAEQNSSKTPTLLLALISSFLLAVALMLGQQGVKIDGEFTLVWWGRLIGLVSMGGLVLLGPKIPRPSGRTVALALTQGLLDTVGLLLLYAARDGLDGTLAAVSSSTLGVMTVILVRILYKERLTHFQIFGIGTVTIGVMALAMLA